MQFRGELTDFYSRLQVRVQGNTCLDFFRVLFQMQSLSKRIYLKTNDVRSSDWCNSFLQSLECYSYKSDHLVKWNSSNKLHFIAFLEELSLHLCPKSVFAMIFTRTRTPQISSKDISFADDLQRRRCQVCHQLTSFYCAPCSKTSRRPLCCT